MNILGIETSCDETAVAIVTDGLHIQSNIVVSQIDIFKNYGGVIPEIAARSHLEAILPAISAAIKQAQLTWQDINAIAVTHTPGLFGSLLIGTLTARTLALIHQKPLYPIHHLKSHIYSVWPSTLLSTTTPSSTLQKSRTSTNSKPNSPLPTFPLLALLVSGGHTQLIHMTNHHQFNIVGTTLDDAVGECFDKVAKILGLPYPGGPAISQLAKSGDPQKYSLPRPKVKNLDFSFSGLKTAVLRSVQHTLNLPISTPSHQLQHHLTDQQKADYAASFQQTAIDILLTKLNQALTLHPAKSIIVAGGVSANSALRSAILAKFPPNQHPQVFFPTPSLSGDNAVMVASAAFFEIQSGISPTNPQTLRVSPTSPIS